MARETLKLPANQPELYEFTSPSGYGLDDLGQMLEMELATTKRRYVVIRLIQRINQLRGEKLYKESMSKIINDEVLDD